MYQPTLFDTSPRVLTVSAINAYLRQKLEADVTLQDLWLEGEISNWKQAASGHIYFTLKDDQAKGPLFQCPDIAAQNPVGSEQHIGGLKGIV